MRQSGILAAAALYALDHHRERLVEDHGHAKKLAESVQKCRGLKLVPESIDTNIVIFAIDPSMGTAAEFITKLQSHGVNAMATTNQNVRMVTHLDVSAAQIDEACDAIRQSVG